MDTLQYFCQLELLFPTLFGIGWVVQVGFFLWLNARSTDFFYQLGKVYGRDIIAPDSLNRMEVALKEFLEREFLQDLRNAPDHQVRDVARKEMERWATTFLKKEKERLRETKY